MFEYVKAWYEKKFSKVVNMEDLGVIDLQSLQTSKADSSRSSRASKFKAKDRMTSKCQTVSAALKELKRKVLKVTGRLKARSSLMPRKSIMVELPSTGGSVTSIAVHRIIPSLSESFIQYSRE